MYAARPISSDPRNHAVEAFVEEARLLFRPRSVRWCTGSAAEYRELIALMIARGTAEAIDPAKRPGSILVRSDPADVARVEEQTFICSKRKDDAGPTNNWADPFEMKARLRALFRSAMAGRVMYVIPYSMGPIGSTFSRIGIMVTDSAYAAANMHIMARVGDEALAALVDSTNFVRGLHSVGAPLASPSGPDVAWPCNATKYIAQFPETREIWSYGSGYGGNALLGKKCHALRIASVEARDEGWMAEHMLILKLSNPQGRTKYIAAAFPSACGKTNLAMVTPSIPGWKVETLGDDIAWLRIGRDGRLRAINPEAGFFGVAPGTSEASNPNAMATIKANTIFTNVALADDGDVYWEQMREQPSSAVDWRGAPWTPASGRPAAHANARFTAPASQCPVIAPEWEDPEGVPIDAILFGGRRARVMPLVMEALSWQHGTFLGAIMASEKTAAAAGTVGDLRRDPMAMLPFCGYHMGDYFQHWLDMGETLGDKRPRIFHVNWFRKGVDGKFLWPGFGDNARVLRWIFERCDGEAPARETPIGFLPDAGGLDVSGLDIADDALSQVLSVDKAGWAQEVASIRRHFETFGDRLPSALQDQLQFLATRIGRV